MSTKKKPNKKGAKKTPIPKPSAKPIEKPSTATREAANEKAIEAELIKLMEEDLCPSINIDIRFELGVGRVKARLSRNGAVIDTKIAESSQELVFDICCTGDVISLTGVCSAKAIITTNRLTNPLTDKDHPRVFEEQDILDILSVE